MTQLELDRDGFGPSGPVEQPTPAPEPRRSRRMTTTLVLVGIVSLLGFLAWLIPLPYYSVGPGPSEAVAPLVKIEDAKTYRHRGEVLLTTVTVREVNGYVWLGSLLDGDDELVPRHEVDGGLNPEQIDRLNAELMDDSKLTAVQVALTKLGYPVTRTGKGAQIVGLVKGAPVAKVARRGDVIVSLDAAPVATVDDAVAVLGAKKAGEAVEVGLRYRGKGRTRTERTTMTTDPDDRKRAILGVTLATYKAEVESSVDVKIRSDGIGGPSAGLAFTLSIMDRLQADDLTHGRRVAATGEIRPDGKVGAIGGIEQKVRSVEQARADVFLVPDANARAARKAARTVRVIGVSDVDEAVAALARL